MRSGRRPAEDVTATHGGADARCLLCKARALAATGRRLVYDDGRERRFPLACRSCGLLLDAGPGPAAERDWDAMLSQRIAASPPAAAFGLDIYTLRIAAGARALRAVPADPAQAEALRHPHGNLAGRARLVDFPSRGRPAVALGAICPAGDVEAVVDRLRPHAEWASEFAILASGPLFPARALAVRGLAEGFVRLAGRPLDGDFAAQRNALQALSRAPWMLQLDADETLAPEAGRHLPGLALGADEEGLVSIGLARRNLVDGVLSDVYPDVQYRLNRREILYEGRVHERPVRPWQRSSIALHSAIDHHLTRAHVLSRSARYEAISPGRGRTEEAEALLQPYRD